VASLTCGAVLAHRGPSPSWREAAGGAAGRGSPHIPELALESSEPQGEEGLPSCPNTLGKSNFITGKAENAERTKPSFVQIFYL